MWLDMRKATFDAQYILFRNADFKYVFECSYLGKENRCFNAICQGFMAIHNEYLASWTAYRCHFK